MLTKKFWSTFLVVFITLEVTNLLFSLITAPVFNDPQVMEVLRPDADLDSKMWIIILMDLIWSFLFVLIFSKGYENKGILEGVRYGIYIGLFYSMVTSYTTYALFPMPYKFALTLFLTGLIQCIILGIVAALVYKPKSAPVT